MIISLYQSIAFIFPTTLSPTPNSNCRECSLGMCRYHKASKQNTVCTLHSPLPTLQSTLHTLFSLHFSVYSLQSMSAHTQLWSLLVLVRFLEMRTTLDALPQVDSAIERAGDGGEREGDCSSVNAIYLMPVSSGSKYPYPFPCSRTVPVCLLLHNFYCQRMKQLSSSSMHIIGKKNPLTTTTAIAAATEGN